MSKSFTNHRSIVGKSGRMSKPIQHLLAFFTLLTLYLTGAYSAQAQCTKPNAGADAVVCLPKTSIKLADAGSGKEWVLASGNPGAATINSTTGQVSGMSTLGAYQFILRVTGQSTCSDTIKITVNDAVKYYMCSNESYNLYVQPGVTNVQWMVDKTGSGTYTVISGATGLVYEATEPGVYTYTAVDANGCDAELCCPVTILGSDCCNKPNAGSDLAICMPTSTADLPDAVTNQQWSVVAGNPAAATVNATTGVVSGMTSPGTYRFVLTDITSVTPCKDTVAIVVTPQPTPTVNSPTICQGSSATLTIANCAGTVHWLDGPITMTRTVSPTATTTYSFTCTVSTCESAKVDAVVTVVPLPNAGADTSICAPLATINLKDAAAGQAWSFVSGPATASINATTGVVTGMSANGDYIFKLASTPALTGCEDEIKVTVLQKPAPTVNNPTICQGSSATLTVTGCTGTLHWNDGPVTMSRTVSPSVTTTYTFICSLNGCDSDPVNAVVTVVPLPNAGADTSICAPLATINLKDAAAGQAWSFVSGPATASINATTGVVTGMSANGDYIFKLASTPALTGCEDEIKVTVLQKPAPTVNNPTICQGSSATLTVTGCTGTLHWNDGPVTMSRTVSPSVTTTYTFVCSLNGCDSDPVDAVVTVVPKPNAGEDKFICEPTATIDLVDAAAGQTWMTVVGNPAAATINGTTGVVAGMSTNGVYQFRLTSTLAGCEDTVKVTRKPIPVPTVNSPTICEGSTATLTVANCNGTVRWFDASPVTSRVVNPTTTTTYSFTCTEDGCESLPVVATVTVVPKPKAGPDIAFCEPATTADLPDAAAGQTWGVVPGNPATAAVNATSGAITGMTANGNYYFVLSSTLAGCNDSVMVTRKPQPKPTVNSPEFCIGESATLTVENCLGTVSWTDGSTSFIRTVSPTATTTYTFTCTENGCPSEPVVATVTVNPKPVLTITTPKVICDGTSVQLNVTSDKPVAGYLWSGSAISNLTIANPIVTPAGSLQETKVYIYTVTVTDTEGCKADASTTVTVTPSLRVNAGVDQTICENGTTALKAVGNLVTSATNGTVTITWSEAATNPNSGSNLASTSGANVNTNALLFGEYEFIATITQVSPDGITNCVNTDVMKVTVIKQPDLSIQARDNGGVTTAICNDNTDAVTLAATLATGTPAAGTIQWSSTDDPTLAFLSCTVCSSPVLTVPATYTGATITYKAKVVVTGDNNIECTDEATVTLTINKAPVLTISTPKIICDGTTVQLNVTSNTTATSYLWSGGPLNNNAIANPIVSPAGSLQENTEYIYTVLVTDVNGCSSTTTTKVTVTPSITVFAGSDQTLCETSAATLTATTNIMTSATNGTITVTWAEAASNPSTGTNLLSTTGYSVQTKALAPGEYLFNATVTQVSPDGITNCVNTDQIKVTVTRAPVVTITPSATDICGKAQETITLGATLSTSAAATYVWSSTDDPTLAFLSCANCDAPTLTVPASYTGSTITYAVRAVVTTDNNQECADDASVTITINPALTVTPITNVTVCNEYIPVKQSRTATLKDVNGANVNISSYEITPMVGITNIVVNGADITFDVTPSSSQIEYTVKLTSGQNCWATTKFWGYQNARPVVDFTMDSYVCLDSKVQVMFNGNAAPGATYTWNFAGATVLYSNDATPYDGVASGPGPHDIKWTTYPGFGNTYRVQLTVNDGGCSATTFKDIRIERGYTVTWDKVNTSACNANDGSITMKSALEKLTNRDVANTLVFTWTGPNGYSYTAPYPAGASLTGLQPGTYHVRVDNSIGGCAYEYDINILRPENIGLNALVGYKASCGKTDGGLHVEAVGGTAPYTFTYYNSAGAVIATHAAVADSVDYLWNLGEGQYSVVIKDSKNCSTSGEIVIDNADGPRVEIVSLVPTACGEDKGEVEFTIFGAAPFSYKIYSSNPYPGGTITQSGIPVKLEFMAEDDYVLEVTDANGCVTIKRFSISSTGANFAINVEITPGACAFNPNGSTNPQTGALKVLSPLGAGYTYTWKKADGTTLTTTTPTNPTGLATGIYKLIVSNGVCSDSTTAVINPAEGPKPQIVATTNPSCPDATDGSVTIIVNKNPDTGQPDKNIYDLTNVGPFYYTIKNTTSQNGLVLSGQIEEAKNLTIGGLEEGTYLVTITDRNQCIGYQTFTITDKPAFEILVDRQNLEKCDTNDGKACFTVTGSNGGTYDVSVAPNVIVVNPITEGVESCLFGLSANVDYNVTVTDTKGCKATFPVKLTQPTNCFNCDEFVIHDMEAYNMDCDSTSAGKVRVTVTGGKAPFVYKWYNGTGTIVSQVTSNDTTNMVKGLPAGVYYVEVTDANQCSKGGNGDEQFSLLVGQSGGPVVTITSSTPTACGGSTGQIKFSVTGKLNFTYTLTPVGSTTALATGTITNIPNGITLSALPAQSYILKVTDVNGCTTIKVVDITSKEFPMNLVTTTTAPNCDGTTLGSIDLSLTLKAGATAPTGTPTITWSGPEGTFTPTNPMKAEFLVAGTYTITVAYANGCSDSKEVTLSPSDGPTVTATSANASVTCIGESDGSFTFSANGNGSPIIGYIVKGVKSHGYSMPYPTTITNELISGLQAGEYEIEIIGLDGCVGSTTIEIKQPEEMKILVETTPIDDCDIDNATLTISMISGGIAPHTVKFADSTATHTLPYTWIGLAKGSFVLEVMDDSGCVAKFPVVIESLRDKLCYGTIGDYVWKDKDNDGIQDATEVGVDNVKVILWSASSTGSPVAKLDSMLTAGGGKYTFDTLAKGNYLVQIVKSTLPVGCYLSDSTNKGSDDAKDTDFDPTSGISQLVKLDPIKGGLDKDNPTIDGALFTPVGSIGDIVWKDKDNDGLQDPTETGVKDVKLILWSASPTGTPLAKLDSTTTNATGFYKFDSLLKGDYIVQIVPSSFPDGCYISTKNDQGSNDLLDDDFNPTSGLSPVVKLDPIKGGLDKDNPTIDGALFTPVGSIGDYVWKDKDNDGTQDAGELGVDNVKVILWSASSTGSPVAKLDSMLTKDGGKYLFDSLKKGDYLVQFVTSTLPEGCYLSEKPNTGDDTKDSDANSTTGITSVVKLDPIKGGLDQDNPTVDAGLFTPVGSIGDFVWKDANDNGIQDATEAGINNVKVILWKADVNGNPITKLDSMLTAGGGKYTFDSLAKGNYVVQFVTSTLPAGCYLSKKPNTGDDTKDSDADPTTGFSSPVMLDPIKGGLDKDNPTVDAAVITVLGSIGDYVWKDTDNDGIQDATEAGVNGVTVNLWSADQSGNPITKLATQVTASGGKYLFEELPAGRYIVQIDEQSLPDGCALSDKRNEGADDTKDNDFDPSNGLSPVVTLDPVKGGLDQDNPTIDAALKSTLGSIGDYVWKDANDDGIQDATESGVNGVTVNLWSADQSGNPLTKLATTVTANGGKYLFDELPAGRYIVQLGLATLPAGCSLTEQTNIGGDDAQDSDFNPTSGYSPVVTLNPAQGGLFKDNPTIDGGLISQLGSIGDYVWKDTDNDGIQDANEAGVDGVTVRLWSADASGNPIAQLKSTVTVSGGGYSFTDLPAGNYVVQVVSATLPAGCELSDKKDVGGDDTKDSDFNPTTGYSPLVTLNPSQGGLNKDNPTIDAALKSTLGSIGDYVWKDTNDNGVQDATETGVDGVKVVLWSADVSGNPIAILKGTTTSGGGYYIFTDLPAGRYIVQLDRTSLPVGCSLSEKPNAGTNDAKDSDFDPNTAMSPVVTLDPTLGGMDKDNPTIDAGLVSPLGSIGDYVWKDTNDNGIQDATETGVNGVTVALWSANTAGSPVAKLQEVVTSNGGAYMFSNLPAGRYLVQIVTATLPAGCAVTDKSNVGGNDAKDSDFNPTTGYSPLVVLDPSKGGLDKDNPTVDAGLKNILGSIGDYVWKDANDNGIQESTEAGVNGVKVALWTADVSGNPVSKVEEVVTADGGKYLFDELPAGRYIVKIDITTLPDGCSISTKPNVGSNDAVDSDFNPTTGLSPVVTLTPENGGMQKDNPTIDAGLISTLGSIGDIVWKDADNDGIQDATEAGVNGVTVNLWSADASGNPIAKLNTTVTAGGGIYSFTNLPAGKYLVQVDLTTLPDGCALTDKSNVGSDDTKDSDFNPNTGYSPVVTLNPAQGGLNKDNPTIDAGLKNVLGSIGDYVWKDTNDNGLQDAAESGVNGVTVNLWSADASGNLITKLTSVVTSNGGQYLFSNLSAGKYIVQIDTQTLPAGCTITTKSNTGSDDAKDSDFNPTTGNSPLITLNPANGGLEKDNPTIDAGLLSTLGSIGDLVWKDADNDGIQDATETGVNGVTVNLWSADASGNPVAKLSTDITSSGGLYSFDNLPAGKYIVQLDLTTLPADCKLSDKMNVGSDDNKDSDFNYATGYSPVVTLNPAQGSLSKDNPTIDAALISTGKPKLHVTKTVDRSIVQVGDIVTYTIKVWNSGTKDTSNVEVQEALYTGAQYLGSVATNGTYNSATKIWTIGTLVAKGDTAKLTVNVKVVAGGNWLNRAVIRDPNDPDDDDSTSVCVSAIIPICPERGESVELSAPAGYTTYQWYNNNQPVVGATSQKYTATKAGSYTVKVNNGQCPAEGCCPVVVAEVCECPVQICVPFTIQKKR